MHVQRALYKFLKGALLFHEKLVGKLEEYGLEINPYDPYVANKTVGENS